MVCLLCIVQRRTAGTVKSFGFPSNRWNIAVHRSHVRNTDRAVVAAVRAAGVTVSLDLPALDARPQKFRLRWPTSWTAHPCRRRFTCFETHAHLATFPSIAREKWLQWRLRPTDAATKSTPRRPRRRRTTPGPRAQRRKVPRGAWNGPERRRRRSSSETRRPPQARAPPAPPRERRRAGLAARASGAAAESAGRPRSRRSRSLRLPPRLRNRAWTAGAERASAFGCSTSLSSHRP